MNPRERLLRCIEGGDVDRPPVIVPGGMMTMATTEAMCRIGRSWPAAHRDGRAMADVVLATQDETGLECLAAPFCMTVESEALGCAVDLGSERVLPHVIAERVRGVEDVGALRPDAWRSAPRALVTLDALRILKSARPEFPVIGAVCGPVTLAAMVMDAGLFFRLLRRNPDAARRLVAVAEEFVAGFALAQRDAGADVVLIAEPSATGEILGARHFDSLAAPALARLRDRLRKAAVPNILHVCGDLRPILRELRRLADATDGPLTLSVDAMVGAGALRDQLPGVVRAGNVDAVLLERGPVGAIEAWTRHAAAGFQIVCPACGLVPATPSAHLRTMTDIVRGAHGPTPS